LVTAAVCRQCAAWSASCARPVAGYNIDSGTSFADGIVDQSVSGLIATGDTVHVHAGSGTITSIEGTSRDG
jgi:hypothetical protein